MKPGHIRVFDGLRITTEHVEHLQGSLHSALEDLRTILGLGRVHYGFEVEAESNNSIIVQPGLAFDWQKNRIVLDEPKTLPVSFASGEASKFVSVRYDQIEDGQVEDQFTLVWDTCAAVVTPNAPAPGDNLIPLARLDKTNGNGAFEVVSLVTTDVEEATVDEGDADEAPVEEATNGATPPEQTAGGETSASKETSGSTPVIIAPPLPVANAPSSEKTAAPPQPIETRTVGVRQGVVRLTAENDAGDYLGALLSGPLKKKLSAAKENGADAELSLNLTTQEVELDFAPVSLTCRTLVKLGLALDGEMKEEKEKGEAAPYIKAHADGEAVFDKDEARQFGLTTVYAGAYTDCELTERGVARLPFRLVTFDSALEEPAALAALFGALELHVRVARASERGFRVLCALVWAGAINEEVLKSIEVRKPRLTWETLVAWKALGDSFALTR